MVSRVSKVIAQIVCCSNARVHTLAVLAVFRRNGHF